MMVMMVRVSYPFVCVSGKPENQDALVYLPRDYVLFGCAPANSRFLRLCLYVPHVGKIFKANARGLQQQMLLYHLHFIQPSQLKVKEIHA